MPENIENLILEHLKKIQAELSAARERDERMLQRMANVETALARIGRDSSHNYEEIIENRHMIDKLQARLERVERRLEING